MFMLFSVRSLPCERYYLTATYDTTFVAISERGQLRSFGLHHFVSDLGQCLTQLASLLFETKK